MIFLCDVWIEDLGILVELVEGIIFIEDGFIEVDLLGVDDCIGGGITGSEKKSVSEEERLCFVNGKSFSWNMIWREIKKSV